MIVKLATLFLVAMAILGLIFGRRGKGRDGKPGRKGAGKTPGKTAEAARCPDCGAWIVAGARCPCGDGKG